MKKKGSIIVTLVVITIIGISFGVMRSLINTKPTARMSKKEAPKIGVKAWEEVNDSYDLEIKYPAKVASFDVITLGVEVSGKIQQGDVPLKVGQNFKKGDLIFSLNDDDANAKLMSAKSKFITLISQSLPDIKVDLPHEYDKWYNFFLGISLDKQLPKLPIINSSKEKVYMSSKNIISTYYDIAQQQIVFSKYKIYAPFNGVFKSVNREVGAIVGANSQVGTISSTEDLEAVASVTQSESSRIKVGSTAEIISRSGKHYKGIVNRISSFIEPTTQRVDVFIILHEPTRAIIEGEMVSVNIPIGRVDGVVKLPLDAVGQNGIIYGIDKDNKIYHINAKVEYESGEWAYVSGIKDGELIVQESLMNMRDGSEVNLIRQHVE